MKQGLFWLCFWGLGLLPLEGKAAVMVTPLRGGDAVGNNVYYGVLTSSDQSLSGAVVDNHVTDDQTYEYQIMDLRKVYSANDASIDDTAGLHALTFNVSSSSLSASTQIYFAIVLASSTDSSSLRYMPIAFVNDSPCGSDKCDLATSMTLYNTGTVPNNTSSQTRYLLVKVAPSETLSIGFYYKEFCDYFPQAPVIGATSTAQGGGVGYGCDHPPVAGSTTGYPMKLNFRFLTRTTNSSGVTQDNVLDSTDYYLNFQVDKPSLDCPAQSARNSMYFPGDGQIYMDLSSLLMKVNGNYYTQATWQAKPTKVIVVANPSSTGVFNNTTNFLNNERVTRQEYGATSATITKLTNSVEGDIHNYDVSFLLRDASGQIAEPSDASNCKVTGVQASPIYGFLNKSNCFIATAAYRSVEAAPVKMLRQFRDLILKRYEWGQAFVRWYYRWSPPAAHWLMQHPQWRLPVLMFLLPVEMAVWMILHPLSSVLGFFVILMFVFRKNIFRLESPL